MRNPLLLSTCLLTLLLATPARAAAPQDVSLLVAPFEALGPPGSDMPDAARLLADRLGTRGLGRVVGPSELGIQAIADPSEEQLRAWGEAAKVPLVVVGRSTRIGQRVSLDVRLRSADGATVATYVAEAPRPEALEGAIDRLAGEIVEGALGAPPPVSARASARKDEGDAEGDGGEGGGFLDLGGGGARSGQPISIQSDELEAIQDGASRRFVFKRNVRLKQGAMVLTARQMEAFYPPGASQPERMVAQGKVVLVQQGKEARCDEATFWRKDQRVVCVGDQAQLLQSGDRVTGKEIEFFLDTEKLVVRGGADVFLDQKTDDAPGDGE